ncbi:MAG: hypothetical protein RL124_995 [Acidobacteriota bacterium]
MGPSWILSRGVDSGREHIILILRLSIIYGNIDFKGRFYVSITSVLTGVDRQ